MARRVTRYFAACGGFKDILLVPNMSGPQSPEMVPESVKTIFEECPQPVKMVAVVYEGVDKTDRIDLWKATETEEISAVALNDIVRNRLLTQPGYLPYCGADNCSLGWSRTSFDGEQFVCGCGWKSSFEDDFIKEYKDFLKLQEWSKTIEERLDKLKNETPGSEIQNIVFGE